MLGHLALVYYFVRLPGGTFETELVTKVYDAMLIVFALLAMLEGAVKQLGDIPTPLLSFFWGMLMMVVALILLIDQPETWLLLGITLLVTALAIVALVRDRKSAASSASSE